MRTLRPNPRSRSVSRFDAVARPAPRGPFDRRCQIETPSCVPGLVGVHRVPSCGRRGLIPPGNRPEFTHHARWEIPLRRNWYSTTLCEAGRLGGLLIEQFFTESLILAQDERWRRA